LKTFRSTNEKKSGLFLEQHKSGLTAFAPVSDVSTLACTNGVWPLLQLVGMVQKNRLLTILSFNVQSINLPMEHMAWLLWITKQLNGYSTSAPRSNAAWRWIERTHSDDELLYTTLVSKPTLHIYALVAVSVIGTWQTIRTNRCLEFECC